MTAGTPQFFTERSVHLLANATCLFPTTFPAMRIHFTHREKPKMEEEVGKEEERVQTQGLVCLCRVREIWNSTIEKVSRSTYRKGWNKDDLPLHRRKGQNERAE